MEGSAFSPQTQTLLEGMFDRYLTEGGFPDVQNRLNEDRIETDAGPIDVVPAWKWFLR